MRSLDHLSDTSSSTRGDGPGVPDVAPAGAHFAELSDHSDGEGSSDPEAFPALEEACAHLADLDDGGPLEHAQPRAVADAPRPVVAPSLHDPEHVLEHALLLARE
eukprot:10445947-Alexandrium_andersonii.AAC.1